MNALSAKHYEGSHLPGAANLAYKFVDAAETVLPDKDADISFSGYKMSNLRFRALLADGGQEVRFERAAIG